jgi:hypothetical protein
MYSVNSCTHGGLGHTIPLSNSQLIVQVLIRGTNKLETLTARSRNVKASSIKSHAGDNYYDLMQNAVTLWSSANSYPALIMA